MKGRIQKGDDAMLRLIHPLAGCRIVNREYKKQLYDYYGRPVLLGVLSNQ
jgi:hypothetical protein